MNTFFHKLFRQANFANQHFREVVVVLGKNYATPARKYRYQKAWNPELSIASKINVIASALYIVDGFIHQGFLPKCLCFSGGATAGEDTRGVIPTESEALYNYFLEVIKNVSGSLLGQHILSQLSIVLENKSLTTYGNSLECAHLWNDLEQALNLKSKEHESVVLATVGFHLPRAIHLFHSAGFFHIKPLDTTNFMNNFMVSEYLENLQQAYLKLNIPLNSHENAKINTFLQTWAKNTNLYSTSFDVQVRERFVEWCAQLTAKHTFLSIDRLDTLISQLLRNQK
jgi:hypothetical protein